MAFESRFWRKQIKKDITFLKKKLNFNTIKFQDVPFDPDLDEFISVVEIKLFTTAYSLRKLMDTKKFPDSTSKEKVEVRRYKRNKISFVPWGYFDDYYYMNENSKIYLDLREICNQFIHSYFFQPLTNSKGFLSDLFFVSEHDRNECLYSLEIKNFLDHISIIVDKYPKLVSHTYDKTKDEYIAKASE